MANEQRELHYKECGGPPNCICHLIAAEFTLPEIHVFRVSYLDDSVPGETRLDTAVIHATSHEQARHLFLGMHTNPIIGSEKVPTEHVCPHCRGVAPRPMGQSARWVVHSPTCPRYAAEEARKAATIKEAIATVRPAPLTSRLTRRLKRGDSK